MKMLHPSLSYDLVDVLPAPPPSPFARIRGLAIAAFGLVGVFIIGFGTWAALAPLESAAIAVGAFEAESSRKTVQHLEGGIIGKILVKEGDQVQAGQVLIQLDDTRPRTNLIAAKAQLWDAQAREARLFAERDNLPSVTIPPSLVQLGRKDPGVAEIVAGQVKIFETRRKLLESRIAVLRQRIAQTEREIVGRRAQEVAVLARAAIIKDELGVVQQMVAKGLERRPRLLALEREQAEIEGRRGELAAQIARSEQAIGEDQAEILKLQNDFQNEVAQTLRDTQTEILQLVERIQAAADVLARTKVRAPEAGTITDLRIHTPGGVVAAGEPLMDLVPQQDRLIIRAQIRPEDIDLVRTGLSAQVRLLSYKQRRVPPVDGVVTYVSADRLVDKRTDQPYYVAKIQLDEDMLRRMDGVEVVAGMPVEALIKTGESTVALYALSPILDSLNRAFRED